MRGSYASHKLMAAVSRRAMGGAPCCTRDACNSSSSSSLLAQRRFSSSRNSEQDRRQSAIECILRAIMSSERSHDVPLGAPRPRRSCSAPCAAGRAGRRRRRQLLGPGFFGSLAAAPLQPGFSAAYIYYHTTVNAGADVAFARQVSRGRLTANFNANLNLNLNADADIGLFIPQYTFATPFLGGQATLGLIASYGRNTSTVDGTLTASLGPFGVTVGGSRTDTIWGSETCSRCSMCAGTMASTTG